MYGLVAAGSSTNAYSKPELLMDRTIFALVLLFLFTLQYTELMHEGVLQPFTQWLATISAWVVQFYDSNVTAQGIVLRNLSNGTGVAIKNGCNGVEPMIFLTAAMLAYPALWKERLTGLLLGYLAIQAMNIVRIISLFYLLQWDQQWFEWFHLYVWQVLIFLDMLMAFVLWIRWLPSRKAAEMAPPPDGVTPHA